jgi:hypothetical protein
LSTIEVMISSSLNERAITTSSMLPEPTISRNFSRLPR